MWHFQKKKPLYTLYRAHGPSLDDQAQSEENKGLPQPGGALSTATGQTASAWKDPYWISCIASLPYSDVFATGSCGGFVRLWKVDNGRSFSAIKDIPLVR